MSSLSALIRAIFVLPFSAGHPKRNEADGTISHDGSISGIVFLVGIAVILCEILLIGSDGTFKLFTATMMITTGMGILICVALTIYAHLKPEVTIQNENWDIGGKIMLRFLWLFTLASLVFSGIYLTYHIECYKNHFTFDNVKERMTCDVLLFLFRLVQTGFLTKFSQQTFKNKLGCYYGLLVLFLANISVIAIEFTHEIQNIRDYTVNTTTSSFTCYTNTSIGHLIEEVEDYMDPAVLEYCLLSVLFISSMWPGKASTKSERNLSCVYDSFSRDEITSLLSNRHNDDDLHVNMNTNTNAYHKTCIFGIIITSALLNIPTIILFAYRIYDPNGERVNEAFISSNSFVLTILFIVLVKCFYIIQSDCVATYKVYTFAAKDYLILASFIGSLVYYTMRIMAYIELLHDDKVNVVKLYSYVVMIVSIYFQTVLIFQMKHYEKGNNPSSFTSIEYTFLFLSLNNLIIWGTDSFLASTYVFAKDAPTKFYGKKIWVTFYSLVFPFVVFYRFKCFVAFYSIYHKLKR